MTGSPSQAHSARDGSLPPRSVQGSTDVTARSSVPKVALVAFAAGAVLGCGDLLVQRYVGYPWADLANSPAMWAAAAFFVGWWVRSPSRSAAAGIGTLVTAVASYYLIAAAVLGDDVANAFNGPAQFWYVGAICAGGFTGLAGALCRSPVSNTSCGVLPSCRPY